MNNPETRKQWKKNNPRKCKETQIKYYEKSRKEAHNKGSRWCSGDLSRVLDGKVKDAILAKKIGRSIKAIEIARSRLKKKRED